MDETQTPIVNIMKTLARTLHCEEDRDVIIGDSIFIGTHIWNTLTVQERKEVIDMMNKENFDLVGVTKTNQVFVRRVDT